MRAKSSGLNLRISKRVFEDLGSRGFCLSRRGLTADCALRQAAAPDWGLSSDFSDRGFDFLSFWDPLEIPTIFVMYAPNQITLKGFRRPKRARITRRRALELFGWLAAGTVASACGVRPDESPDASLDVPLSYLDFGPENPSTNVRALMNVFLPTEYGADGRLLSPGALEVQAFEVLKLSDFISAAQAQGLLPRLPADLEEVVEVVDPVLVGFISTEIDLITTERYGAIRFRELHDDQQRELVEDALDHPERGPVFSFVRSVCFLAFLGAIKSDAGLVDVGYPPFEDFDAGIAQRGYPRTRDGRRVDAESEDLDALEAAGDLDDYTYNRAPAPVAFDDLEDVVNPFGDLY